MLVKLIFRLLKLMGLLVRNAQSTAKMNPIKQVPSEDFNVLFALRSIASGKQTELATTIIVDSLGSIFETAAPTAKEAPALLEASSKAYQ